MKEKLGKNMKKALIGFTIIIIGILLSCLAIAFTISSSQEPNVIIPDKHVLPTSTHLINNDSTFSLLDTSYSTEIVNRESKFNKLIPIIPSDGGEGGLIAIGFGKNATGMKKGLIHLYNVSQVQDQVITALIEEYSDSGLLSSEYISGTLINGSLNEASTDPMIVALRKSNETIFEVDFFSISLVNGISLNSSFTIPATIVLAPVGIKVLDVDNDNIQELYIMGENNSLCILAEFKYNSTNNSYYYSHSLSWSALQSSGCIDFTTFETASSVDFIITGLNSSTGQFLSYTIAITLNRDTIRQFNITSISEITYPAPDYFRVFSMKQLRSQNPEYHKLVLFGVKFGEMNPGCVVLNYTDGKFGDYEIFVKEEILNHWSLDGIIFDLDLDESEEIILTSYNAVVTGLNSSINLLTKLEEYQEIDMDIVESMNIKACTTLNLVDSTVIIWTGENSSNEAIIEFYLINYRIPLWIRGGPEILLSESSYLISFEPTDISGGDRIREDLDVYVGFKNYPNSFKILNKIPGNISLEAPLIDYSTTETIMVSIVKEGKEVRVFEYEVTIELEPLFQIELPPSPVIPEYNLEQIPILLHIENRMATNYIAEISLGEYGQEWVYGNEIIYLSPGESRDIYLEVPLEKRDYIEDINITIDSNTGKFQFLTQIEVARSSSEITSADVMGVFWIILVLTFIVYMIFGAVIFYDTRTAIHEHLETDNPLKLEFPWIKSLVIPILLRKYEKEGNWEFGIKLAAKYYKIHSMTAFLKLKAKESLQLGQEKISQKEFMQARDYWIVAREDLEKIGYGQWLKTLDMILEPIKKIVEVENTQKGVEKASSLLKAFQHLSALELQRMQIMDVQLSVPLYLVAEKIGFSFRDAKDLQSSLTYLQLAYQAAPDAEKTRIVNTITELISLGGTPTEISLPFDEERLAERISKRSIRCFVCGTIKEEADKLCTCGSETVICSVCKLPLTYGITWAECPHCNWKAHQDHLREWIKMKGTCPVCKKNVSRDDLLVNNNKNGS